jgi:hypothetical protein
MTSVSVEFRGIGPGTCGWCRREKDEVYSVAFADKSFVGSMCRKDLLSALAMKIGMPEPERKLTPASPSTATK